MSATAFDGWSGRMWGKPWVDCLISAHDAKWIAEQHGVPLPRVGYEVYLGGGLWLQSTSHFQFGWFGSSVRTPYRVWGRPTE